MLVDNPRDPTSAGLNLLSTEEHVAVPEVGSIWYNIHHGVYHSKNPQEIRVVFNCSVKFDSFSLNDMLLQEADLPNQLTGVLFCFGTEQVPFTGDIEAMLNHAMVP